MLCGSLPGISGASVTGRNRALSRTTLGTQLWKMKKFLISGCHFVLEERVFQSRRIHVVPDRGPHACCSSIHLIWLVNEIWKFKLALWALGGHYAPTWWSFCNTSFHFEFRRLQTKRLVLLKLRLQSQLLKNWKTLFSYVWMKLEV